MKRIFALLIIVFGSLYCNAQDYVPLVREGVKWKCGMLFRHLLSMEINSITPYSIYFEGDTIIGNYTYKNCLVIPDGYSGELADSVICGYVREDIAEKKVYFLCNQDYRLYSGPRRQTLPYEYSATGWEEEVLWYDFNDILQSVELSNRNIAPDDVIIDLVNNSGQTYKRHRINDIVIIEGVGCGGALDISSCYDYKMGDLLCINPSLMTGYYNYYPLFYHLEDAEGNIIYDAPSDPPSYVPLAREDIKWKYTRVFNPEVPEAMERVPFTMELKGDTIIRNDLCKKVVWTNDLTGEQTVGDQFLHEYSIAAKVVFLYEKGNENRIILYDFDKINDGEYCGDVDVSIMQDSTIMLGNVKTVCHKFDYGDGRKYSFIEGVGFVNETPNEYGEYDGNLLCFLQGTDPDASYYDVFMHLEDADGNILYTAPKSPYGFDGIEEVGNASEDAVEVARYDVHGRLLTKPVPGINIIRMSDGSVRKQLHRE